jgi:hypothetical protein
MKTKLFAFASLVLVACASQNADNSDSSKSNLGIPTRFGNIDNVGIVESGTMMQASTPLSHELDEYNAEDPFAIKPDAYINTFTTRLTNFDSYDGKADWTPEQAQTWNTRMTTGNYQIIDTSMPCDWENPHTYLEIERAQLTGQDHKTCGGRMPNEDALDVTANFLIRGPGASVLDADALTDGVNQATQKSTDEFPYLAELNPLF